ncbi:hypothetical protein J8I87_05980 [Paraburkholderia sp. LEh10]|nr:hypothetical protein [Paraburkholderia sp. LEh10]
MSPLPLFRSQHIHPLPSVAAAANVWVKVPLVMSISFPASATPSTVLAVRAERVLTAAGPAGPTGPEIATVQAANVPAPATEPTFTVIAPVPLL